MVHRIGDKTPDTGKALFLAWNAEIVGNVVLGEDVTVWFGAVLRGDIAGIRVGSGTNIQDNATVHVDYNKSCHIGSGVTVGHNAIVHGCTVEDGSLIGMGAIILSGAVIGRESIVGAGALVTGGKVFPPRSLIIGSPAKVERELTGEELERLKRSAANYIKLGKEAVRDLVQL